ncbi:MAG: DM13 domain-containing protein [Actinomycetota bacterium]
MGASNERRTNLERAGDLVAAHRRPVMLTALVSAVAAVFALVWFQPHKLFVDQRVSEAIPGAVRGVDADGESGNGADPEGRREGTGKPDEPAGAPGKTEGPRTIRRGALRGLEHETSGQASVVQLPDGRTFLRFEGLSTSNGPDLRVYLSEIPAGDDWYAYGERFIDLGSLKGNLGDQNYLIEKGTDLSRYESAVIWCRRFTVGFGVAPLDHPG